MSNVTSGDRAHLSRALALAAFSRVRSSPNPSVGCVLVRDGVRLAEGATAPVGGPHAEVVALRAAGPGARGATVYVTLEPCAHEGRTPPCVDALLEAGVRRVVVAHPELHRVARGGSARLRDAGVHVDGPLPVGDLLHDAVAAQLEGFRSVLRDRRPHVTLKLAQTLEGALANPSGARWVTGTAARRAVHRWRCSVDAVLVGSGTVIADDPRLDVREVRCERQPRPVVLDARLRTPPEAAVSRPGAVIVTTEAGMTAARTSRDRLEASGVSLAVVPPDRDGGVALRPALEALARVGVTSVLAEPGPTLALALAEADLVDRVVLHVAPPTGSRSFAPAIGLRGRWRTERTGGAGHDVVLQFVRDRDLGREGSTRPLARQEVA